jgi:hypothetical protein
MRSRQLLSYSRIFQYFIQNYGSLPYSQEPFTSPYPEPDESIPYHHFLYLLHIPWLTQMFIFYFYGMHPVVYLLDNICISIGQSKKQLLQ